MRYLLSLLLLCIAAPLSAQVGLPLHGNWCGPNHPANPAIAADPIDEIDAACQEHDIAYAQQQPRRGDYHFIRHLQAIQARGYQWVAEQVNGSSVAIRQGVPLTTVEQTGLEVMQETILWQGVSRDSLEWLQHSFDNLLTPPALRFTH